MSALLELGSLQTAELVLWCALAGIVVPLSAILISKLVFGKKPRHRSMVDCLAIAAIIGMPLIVVLTKMVSVEQEGSGEVVSSEVMSAPEVVISKMDETSEGRIDLFLEVNQGNDEQAGITLSEGKVGLINSIGLIWLLGVFVMGVRWLKAQIRLYRVLRLTRLPDDAEEVQLRKVRNECGMDPSVSIRVTAVDVVPFFVGILRKWIVVPQKLFRDFSEEELTMVVKHELAHCRQRDQWIALLQQIVCVLYWWSPFVRSLNRVLSQTREELCDHEVTRSKPKEFVQAYSGLLLEITKSFSNAPTPCVSAMASSFRRLKSRIIAMQQGDDACLQKPGRLVIGFSVVVVGALLFTSPYLPSVHSTEEGGGEVSTDSDEEKTLAEMINQLASEAERPVGAVGLGEPRGPELKEQIKISPRFIEVKEKISEDLPMAILLNEEQFTSLMKSFAKSKGVDLLSAPKVVSLNNQKCKVEVTREVLVPGVADDFEVVKAGIELDIRPHYRGGKLTLVGKAVVRELDGGEGVWNVLKGGDFKGEGGAFSFNTAETFFGSQIKEGSTLLLCCRRSPKHKGNLFVALSAKSIGKIEKGAGGIE